jgi:hypothetical protein
VNLPVLSDEPGVVGSDGMVTFFGSLPWRHIPPTCERESSGAGTEKRLGGVRVDGRETRVFLGSEGVLKKLLGG